MFGVFTGFGGIRLRCDGAYLDGFCVFVWVLRLG